jgi:hypothetical protein
MLNVKMLPHGEGIPGTLLILFSLFLIQGKHIACFVYSIIAKGVDTLLPVSTVNWKSVIRVSLSSSDQNIVLNSR